MPVLRAQLPLSGRPRSKVLRVAGDERNPYRLALSSETPRTRTVTMDAQLLLEDGDIVEYRLPSGEANGDGKRLGLGCVQSGQIHPLCKWSVDTDEFLFDEEAAPLELAAAENLLDMNAIWPMSRLVGGGMGPGNPHGEESEDCWSLANVQLSEETRVVVRPEREVWW